MSIRLLEHIRDELRGSGAVQNTPEFCTSWLGRSEGYIRTLRFHGLESLYLNKSWMKRLGNFCRTFRA